MEWQPIETAPKDGSKILLFIPSNVSRWHVSAGYWRDDAHARKASPFWCAETSHLMGITWMRSHQPTHWMPLPAPPKGA